MNRAEKRRQKKLAKKAATKAGYGHPTNSSYQSLEIAKQHHAAGRLAEAESVYQKILQAEPNQPDALYLLGMIARQSGKNELAVDLIAKSLVVNPDNAEGHNILANILKDLGRSGEAVESYSKALALKPSFAEAHYNLGRALQDSGKLEEATESYRKSLAIKPEFSEAQFNLGIALKDLHRLDEAAESLQTALINQPEISEAHFSLGGVFLELNRLDDAVVSYHHVLAIEPDNAEAHNNLGVALLGQGKIEEAFERHRKAISLKPQNDLFWAGLAASLESLSFTSVDENLWEDLRCLLERPSVIPAQIIQPLISALRCDPEFSQVLEMASSESSDVEIFYEDAVRKLSSVPLFFHVLEVCPLNDVKIERMLTTLRHAMLCNAIAGKMAESSLVFSSALALQCFTNEYAFYETDEEEAQVESLQRQITKLFEVKQDVPPYLVAALGAYRPLYRFPWAQELCDREWASNIEKLIKRQISEPIIEQSLRPQIPCLTPVKNRVSKSVREQYEENPYPRWINTGLTDNGRPIGTVLQGAPLHLEIGDYSSPEKPEILVAGCGTGQQALGTASRFLNAHVLAVDLSLSSLSYAMRKTGELGVTNIDYAQADILELSSLERQFDLIECGGVLHHLGNPIEGWQILVNLLRPGGFMKIGLYSEMARQSIVEGRSQIAEYGYASTPADIRQCRQDIFSLAKDGNRMAKSLCNIGDFFCLSECRDLLFHVQEHRFTLPQIESALGALNLKFLGFELLNKKMMAAFKEQHPEKRDLTSLPLWHKFELKNPDTFTGMYQFWCKKM